MSVVFLDTVGVLALFDARDQWHAAAERAWAKLAEEGADLLTTSFVMAECGNAAARRPFRAAVVELHETLRSEGAVIVPTEAECLDAWSRYASGEAGDAGVVDHLSFVVMRRFGLRRVFTNDGHFAAAGFATLF